jgi:hypothetical protein
MDLTPFAAKTVSPGEPITAQAWNELVEGIKALNDFVRSSQATALRVGLGNTDIRLETVRVTARRDDGWLAEAVAPVDGGGEFVFAALPQGAFTVRAEAPGFSPASANVTIPGNASVQLTLEQDGAFMPNLIGVELAAALAELEDRDITVGRLLDVVGRELPPAKPDSEYARQPVLMQLPDPGVAVPPEGKVQIVVSAALQVEESVEVPPLTGLTLEEARKALEAIGLKLGKVQTRRGIAPQS